MTTATISTVNAFTLLEKSTVSLLDAAFNLKEHKEHYSLEEYLALLHKNGWKLGGAEEKRLLSVAETFAPFIHNIQALAKIEPKTIYQLCEDKLAPVITKLQNTASITQDLVVKFIRNQKSALRKQKNGMAPTDGWRYRKNGRIYRAEIIEQDDWTGRAIEELKKTGRTVSEIIRSGMQLLVQQPGWEVNINTSDNDVNSSIEVEEIAAIEIEETPVLEPVQVTPGAIPTCFQAPDEEIEEKLFNELLEEFQVCQSWTRIRNVMYCCNAATRAAAWAELTQFERTRVWTEMPETVKQLSIAKKNGIIRDFREQLCGSKYEIYTLHEEAPFIVTTYMVERTLESISKNKTANSTKNSDK